MNTYHDRYARFGVGIGILVGIALLTTIGLVSSCSKSENTECAQVEVQPMTTYALSENADWCDQFFDHEHDDIQITGQVSDTYIEIFIRDKDTGVMARIAGDNVSSLEMEVK